MLTTDTHEALPGSRRALRELAACHALGEPVRVTVCGGLVRIEDELVGHLVERDPIGFYSVRDVNGRWWTHPGSGSRAMVPVR